VRSPSASSRTVACQISRASAAASPRSSWASRAKIGSFSEKTNVAVSAGVNPWRARDCEVLGAGARGGLPQQPEELAGLLA
jgi:hypothetical protein